MRRCPVQDDWRSSGADVIDCVREGEGRGVLTHDPVITSSQRPLGAKAPLPPHRASVLAGRAALRCAALRRGRQFSYSRSASTRGVCSAAAKLARGPNQCHWHRSAAMVAADQNAVGHSGSSAPPALAARRSKTGARILLTRCSLISASSRGENARISSVEQSSSTADEPGHRGSNREMTRNRRRPSVRYPSTPALRPVSVRTSFSLAEGGQACIRVFGGASSTGDYGLRTDIDTSGSSQTRRARGREETRHSARARAGPDPSRQPRRGVAPAGLEPAGESGTASPGTVR